LYLLALGGGEARQVTALPYGAGPAVWTPDGTRIAFRAPVAAAARPVPAYRPPRTCP
jgi:Tol biopolymer transport system component